MDLQFDPSELAFRDELRAWLAGNEPGAEPPRGGDAHFAWLRDWQRRLHEGGWVGIDWPREFGGREGGLFESAIFYEELGRAGAPLPAGTLGLLLAGPTILVWGDEAQKGRYLEPILSGEEIWCQGFSEPDAGSDLASLKTRAVRDGDEWVIDGQKVWTSSAQYAKWCMLVARTDLAAPRKHEGLTYFLFEMDQPGVTVAPLRQMTGEAEFNEVFFDGARVPHENVLGGVGNGWKVALTTLMNERAGLAFFLQVRLRQLLDQLIVEADLRGLLADDAIAARLGELHTRTETLRLLGWKGLDTVRRHGQPGPEGSLVKWLWSESNQMLTQLSVDILGATALDNSSPWGFELLRAPGNSIEGGTTEILKNIVAERVLGLPRAGR
ncbi:MAG: acyl-CoA dehydrogenase family protein [Actinobacteria bacterium]|nr:acyl-CoA dehydrogenase family protein [Actinomycetota bacterium]